MKRFTHQPNGSGASKLVASVLNLADGTITLAEVRLAALALFEEEGVFQDVLDIQVEGACIPSAHDVQHIQHCRCWQDRDGQCCWCETDEDKGPCDPARIAAARQWIPNPLIQSTPAPVERSVQTVRQVPVQVHWEYGEGVTEGRAKVGDRSYSVVIRQPSDQGWRIVIGESDASHPLVEMVLLVETALYEAQRRAIWQLELIQSIHPANDPVPPSPLDN